jgi:hypothetical protein
MVRVLRETMPKHPDKAVGKTMRIREEDAQFIEREGRRRTRANTDQISHMVKLYSGVLAMFDHDDVGRILDQLSIWKQQAESKKTTASRSTASDATPVKKAGGGTILYGSGKLEG